MQNNYAKERIIWCSGHKCSIFSKKKKKKLLRQEKGFVKPMLMSV